MSLSWQLAALYPAPHTDVALGPAHVTFGELRTPTTESYKKVPIYLARANLNPVRRIKAVPVTFAFTLGADT